MADTEPSDGGATHCLEGDCRVDPATRCIESCHCHCMRCVLARAQDGGPGLAEAIEAIEANVFEPDNTFLSYISRFGSDVREAYNAGFEAGKVAALGEIKRVLRTCG